VAHLHPGKIAMGIAEGRALLAREGLPDILRTRVQEDLRELQGLEKAS
jgi:hypothetical protein